MGLSFFPAGILAQSLGRGAGLPAAFDFVLVVALQALYLFYVARRGLRGYKKSVIAFALGLLVPIMAFGVLAELALPVTVLADLAAIALFRKLWTSIGGPHGITQTAN